MERNKGGGCQSFLKIITGGGNVPEQLITVTFLDTLPNDIADQVRVRCGEKMAKVEAVSVAKSLLSSARVDCYHSQPMFRPNFRTNTQPKFSGLCYGCGKQGHLQKDCRGFCAICKIKGHSSLKCRSTHPENKQVGSALK